MTRREFLLAAPAAAGITGCLGLDPRIFAPPIDAGPVSAANQAFGFDLFDQIRRKPGNQIVSPFSVAMMVNLAAGGANRQTLDEFKSVLHRPETEDLNHGASATLQRQIAAGLARSGCELRAAHGAWVQRGLPIQDDFKDVAEKHYGGALQTADFKQPELAARAINFWFETQTAFKVKTIIKPESIAADTRFVLAGAVHFKGVWSATFSRGSTAYDSFHLADGTKLTTQFMRNCSPHRYAESEEWQAVELGYSGAALSMLVVLPRSPAGLPAVEADLAADQLNRFSTRMRIENVVMSLPKFKMASEYQLDEPLRALGLVRAFQPADADFSRLTTEPIALAAAIHKASIEVAEDGTEPVQICGAAAGQLGYGKAQKEPKVVAADHPFLFAIRDATSGSVLFLGRVERPI